MHTHPQKYTLFPYTTLFRSYKTSVMTYGYFVSESERFCQAATIGSSCLTRSETKDLETLLPQSSSTIFETFRVETPEIYLSNMEANRLCYFFCYASTRVGENLH